MSAASFDMADFARSDTAHPTPEWAVAVAPGVRRLTAPNPGPFTAAGTNTYIVGSGRVAIIDPGPDIPAHVDALLVALTGETVSHILVTHTHRDHSGAVSALKARTGAAVLSGGPHRRSRALFPGEAPILDDANDTRHRPDAVLGGGDVVEGNGWRIEAVATPGHTANHLAFALLDAGLIFSGDHVMGWSTSIVAPPDGDMGDYMSSLDRLAGRPESRLLPGHGPAVDDAHARIAELRRHRLAREAAILDRIRAGETTIPAMVASIYRDIDPGLHPAAARSVLAHLEVLVRRGDVFADGRVDLGGRFLPR
jgi:glyoxylase-like metal-dependent hydrolase (beta-lactamase superfamily II)